MAEVQSEPISRLIAPATLESSRPLSLGVQAMNRAPRCTAHSSRTGKPCKMAASRGMTVCIAHGGRAPQVREAARLRLACLVVPALQAYAEVLKDRKHVERVKVAKDVLDKNKLTGYGTPEDPKTAIYQPPAQHTTFNVNTVQFDKLSDVGLDVVDRLLDGIINAGQPQAVEGQRS